MLVALRQVFDFPHTLSEFVRPREQGEFEPSAFGVLQLLADFFCFGIDLDADAGGAQGAGHLLIVAKALGAKLHQEDRGRRDRFRQQVKLLHRGQQAVETE